MDVMLVFLVAAITTVVAILPLFGPTLLILHAHGVPPRREADSPQFRLLDLICLIVNASLTIGFANSLGAQGSMHASVALLLLVVVVAIWLLGVRWLQRYGVRRAGHRCLFLTVAMPLASMGPGAVVVLYLGKWIEGELLNFDVIAFLLGAALLADFFLVRWIARSAAKGPAV